MDRDVVGDAGGRDVLAGDVGEVGIDLVGGDRRTDASEVDGQDAGTGPRVENPVAGGRTRQPDDEANVPWHHRSASAVEVREEVRSAERTHLEGRPEVRLDGVAGSHVRGNLQDAEVRPELGPGLDEVLAVVGHQ